MELPSVCHFSGKKSVLGSPSTTSLDGFNWVKEAIANGCAQPNSDGTVQVTYFQGLRTNEKGIVTIKIPEDEPR